MVCCWHLVIYCGNNLGSLGNNCKIWMLKLQFPTTTGFLFVMTSKFCWMLVFSDTSLFHDHLINLSHLICTKGFVPNSKLLNCGSKQIDLINGRNVIHSVTRVCPPLIYLFICGCIQNFYIHVLWRPYLIDLSHQITTYFHTWRWYCS
jgi:hypothetical protein